MKYKIFSIILLVALIAGCNLPAGTQTPTSIESIATQAALTVTAAAQLPIIETPSLTPNADPTTTSEIQSTQQSNESNTPVCNLASFVSDVTIPDNTNINLNAGFIKTWRLRNVGSCTWTSSYQIVFDSGDQMGGPVSQQLTNSAIPPGSTVDVSISLTAPASAGTYKGNWKLKDPNGAVFALSTGPFWVQIKAVSQPQAAWPTFKNGDSGPEVRAIQLLLNARGYNLNVDGIFGPITQSKVEDFQTDNNLTEDAIVGPETWQKLIIQVAQGKTGPEVRAVQNLLKNKFGYNLNVDGLFGPTTTTAVKNFQNSKGLTVDGIVGPQTWQALINK
jgi:hypothetical protein